MTRVLFFGISVSILVLPLCARAVGVSASPSELELSGAKREEITAELLVGNPSTAVSVFEVYPEEFESAIVVVPSSFILEGGDQRKVHVRARLKEIGVFRTYVSIRAKPLAESAFSAASGIKIPIRLEVASGRGSPHLSAALLRAGAPISIILVGVLLLICIFSIIRSRRFS
jgi:hypothetical protein